LDTGHRAFAEAGGAELGLGARWDNPACRAR
jgi:hypothetical protein